MGNLQLSKSKCTIVWGKTNRVFFELDTEVFPVDYWNWIRTWRGT